MKVLITGGSGFVGTNLVEHYASVGADIVNVDIAAPRNSAHGRYWTQLDVRDSCSLRKVVHDLSPHLVFHMAARTDLDGTSLGDYSVNTNGVRSIIQAVTDIPELQRVIFASSMLVCALGYTPKHEWDYCPTTLYGQSKALGERYVRDLAAGRFSWTIVRPTSLWGPWFSVPYRDFFDAVAKRIYLHPRVGEIHRSYGFVLNAVHQLDRIAFCQDQTLVDRQVLYLADYQPIEIFRWALTISDHLGVRPPRRVPPLVLQQLAKLGDVLRLTGIMPSPKLTSFRLKNLLTEAVFDMSDLERIAGATPYDMEQGVAITVDWMRESQEVSHG